MSEVNPFASPLSTDLVAAVPAQPQENQWVYRKGKLLVMHKQAVLPDRCVKSNRPAYGQRLKRKLYLVPPAALSHHPGPPRPLPRLGPDLAEESDDLCRAQRAVVPQTTMADCRQLVPGPRGSGDGGGGRVFGH